MAQPDTQRLRYLFHQYLNRQCTEAELLALLEALGDPQGRVALEAIADAAFSGFDALTVDHGVDWEHMYKKMVGPGKEVARVKRMSAWTRWVAAASVLIAFSILGYWMLHKDTDVVKRDMTVATDVIAPVSNRATITLGDGRVVYLDSIGNGMIADQGGVQVVKISSGEIAYKEQGSPGADRVNYNTLTNPGGSKVIDMRLSDGSHVWLNAGSSITYPVAFTGDDRKVVLKGEGYFEITPDKTKPFIVDANGVTTEVLGTHFNVNAYDDEKEVRVTLLEGSVRAAMNNQSVLLRPGEQAVGSMQLLVNKNVDVGQVMAWKNGFFAFSDADLATVLRQVSRWYDVDVMIEAGVGPANFSGKIGRNLSLKEFLNILDQTRIHYRIENKRLVIVP